MTKALEVDINNEKEWRRYVVQELQEIRKQREEFISFRSRLQVWLWIWRCAGASAIGALFFMFRK